MQLNHGLQRRGISLSHTHTSQKLSKSLKSFKNKFLKHLKTGYAFKQNSFEPKTRTQTKLEYMSTDVGSEGINHHIITDFPHKAMQPASFSPALILMHYAA